MIDNQIVIIGTGRVATHLAARLQTLGGDVRQILGRNRDKTQKIASQFVNCDAIFVPSKILRTANYYIVAVSDDAIAQVAASLAMYLPETALILHTSGSVASTVFAAYFKNYGVLYPLQSFSPETAPDWQTLPICIHANNELKINDLRGFATQLSPKVFTIDDKQRASLHVAAVFANNFTNHLFAIAETICIKEQVPFDILRPLIAETARKVQHISPVLAQTGPALRGDAATMQRHIEYLQKYNDSVLYELYKLISENIIRKNTAN
ncbi:MAG: hypothetical protein RI894_2151 [Bacteroidota bacterium]|jgi:predicted short-subunit dehydrogenase-like oxidoreductase (DUF2520 family)